MLKGLCYLYFILYIFLIFTACDILTTVDSSEIDLPFDPYAGGNHPPVASFPDWDYEITGAEIDAVNQCYTASGTSYGRTMYVGDGNPVYKLFAFSATDIGNDSAWGIHTVQLDWADSVDLTYYIMFQESTETCPPEDGWRDSSGVIIPALNVTFIPIAGDVSSSGNSLTATYEFSDSDGDNEESSAYQWYRCASGSDSGTAIPGAVSTSYTIVADDLNKYLKFEVTPVDEHGFAGTPVLSRATCQIGG